MNITPAELTSLGFDLFAMPTDEEIKAARIRRAKKLEACRVYQEEYAKSDEARTAREDAEANPLAVDIAAR